MNELLMNAMSRVGMVFSQAMPLDTATTMNGIVKWAGTIAGALIAVFLIYSIAKDAFGYIKGSGESSVFKIITKVLFLILCIGLIIVAQNWQALGNTAAGIANSGLNIAENAANELIK